MGRKMRARELPEPAKAELARMIRDDRWTLKEIREALNAKFGEEADIGETSIWRFRKLAEKSAERVRATQEAATMLVGRLVDTGTETPRALTELVQSLIHQSALTIMDGDAVTPEQAQRLASALKSVTEAYASVVRTSERIEAAARRKLLEEQAAALAAMPAKPGVTESTMTEIRRVLGIE
jgi:polyhydroxyalkanoate synthesis regulator phasin